MKNMTTKMLIKAAFFLLLLPNSVYAGIADANWQTFANGAYEQTTQDIKVKVLGGFVAIDRTWANGRWQFTRSWNPLQLVTDPANGALLEITRNRYVYKKVGSDGTIFKYDSRRTILKTETGYSWQNRKGDWIEYDNAGLIQKYGDRNNIEVTFSYNAQNKISGVFDHFGAQVLWFEYDGNNNLTSVRDGADAQNVNTRKVIYTYTSNNLVKVTDVNGKDWLYEAPGGVFLSETGPEGHTRTVSYYPVKVGGGGGSISRSIDPRLDYPIEVLSLEDSIGSIEQYEYRYDKTSKEFYWSVKDGVGTVKEYWYNRDGKVIRSSVNGVTLNNYKYDGNNYAATDRNNWQTRNEYDQWENLIRITYPDNSTVSYEYDSRYSLKTKETNENGVSTEYVYDNNGNLKRITEAVGTPVQRITEYTYDIYGQEKTKKRQADAVTAEALYQYDYDNQGNLISEIDPENNITVFTHDIMGNVRTETDPRQKVWRFTYNNVGQLTSEQTPLAYTTAYEYDGRGNQTKIIFPNLHETIMRYDARSRLFEVEKITGKPAKYEYDSADRLKEIIDEEGKSRRTYYDYKGRKGSVVDGNNNVTRFEYNDVGGAGANEIDLPAKIIYPTYSADLFYSRRNQLLKKVDVLPGNIRLVSVSTYDLAGNLRSQTDENNKATHFEYDELNRVILQRDTDQYETQYKFDNRDNLVSLINANQKIHRFTYNRNDRKISESMPMDETQHWFYQNGLLDYYQDAKGQKRVFVYDDDGRVEQNNFSAGGASDQLTTTITFTYNNLGLLSSYNDGISSAIYSYDALGRKETETVNFGPFSKSIGYSYYANGKKNTYTGPDNVTIGYSYNNNNQLASVSIPEQGSILFNEYRWNQPTKVTYPGGITRTLDYDARMQLKSINVKKPDNTTIMDYNYQRDNVGNILQKQTEHGTYTYGYDNLYRLTSANNPTLPNEVYTYDPLGNRLTDSKVTGTWAYNDNNQLKVYDSTSFDYDPNGAQIEKLIGTDKTTYIYGDQGRLIEIKDSANTTVATFYYDPFGRRVAKNIEGSLTYYVYSEDGVVGVFNNVGVQINTYGFLPDSMEPAYVKDSGQYGYYQNDHLGTSQYVITSQGNIDWTAYADAFGQTTILNERITSNVRFAGQYYDQETSLHYNYFRYYDPSTGQYITSDPIGLSGGLNTYGYVGGNPINSTDRFGLSPYPIFNPYDWANCKSINLRFGTDEKEYSYSKKLDKWWAGVTFKNVGFGIDIDKNGRKVGLEADFYNVYIYKMGLVKGIYYSPYVEKYFYCEKELPCRGKIKYESGPHRYKNGESWKTEKVVKTWLKHGEEFFGRLPLFLPIRIPL